MQLTLKQIADRVGGRLEGPADLAIQGLGKIEEAQAGMLTFLANTKYAHFMETTQAAAVIVPEDFVLPRPMAVIRAVNPYFAFMKAVRLFFPEKPFVPQGAHPTAIVGEGSTVEEGAALGAYVVIGRNCRIGTGTQILPGAVVGDGVTVGKDCVIHARVSLREGVRLGDRVVIHDGTVIGSDGFGFAPEGGAYHKIPQVGTVVIEDDVEIGANVTVDRATLGETRIGWGVKLDNLIQVAHNCTIGDHTVIAAQTGLSGSTHVGQWCRIGGQVGFAGHITIGNGVAIMAQSGVSKSIPDKSIIIGSPAGPHRQEMRIDAAKRQLPDLIKEIKQLKAQLAELEAARSGGQ